MVESRIPAVRRTALGNPRVLGSGAEAEIQVMFRAGEGWLAILENFRGDLGDVSGTPVGSVAGNPATLYEINGGELDPVEPGWALVRGVRTRRRARELIAVALGMQPAPAGIPLIRRIIAIDRRPREGLNYRLHDETRSPRQHERTGEGARIG